MKSMKSGFSTTLASLLLLGTISIGMVFGQATLKGHVWSLSELGQANGVGLAVMTKNYTLEFKSEGQVAIKADCNGCGGTWTSTGTALSITLGMCTKMACGLNSLDNQFLAQLALVKSWESNANTLFLKNASNKTLLTLSNGLNPDPAKNPPSGFYQDWNLVRIGFANKPAIMPVHGRSLSFKQNGTTTFQPDCNTCSSEFVATDSKVRISYGMCTMMACTQDDMTAASLASVFTSRDSLNYQLKGNWLWIFFNGDKDTLVYHNIQTTKISQESKLVPLAQVQWNFAPMTKTISFTLSETPASLGYKVSAYTLQGTRLISQKGISEKQGKLEYSFQPGVYLLELEMAGQKQVQTLRIK